MSAKIELARSLKGAPAAIFLALVLHDGPQTSRMLCTYTGYSVKVVRKGLAHLDQLGLAYNDPDLRAWYLVPRTQLLRLLQEALGTAVESDAARGRAAVEAAATRERQRAGVELSTELSTGVSYGAQGEDCDLDGVVLGGGGDGRSLTELADSEYAVEEFTASVPESTVMGEDTTMPEMEGIDETAVPTDYAASVREISTDDREDYASRAQDCSPSRARITAATDPQNNAHEKASKQTATINARAPAQALNSRQRVVKEWLIRGGVAAHSQKMGDLLALDLDLQVVKAHVLERLACEEGLVKGCSSFGAGLLIHKLLAGDSPPPLRCQECLRLPNRLGMCACDYEAIIKR